MSRVGVDLDGCLAAFNKGYAARILDVLRVEIPAEVWQDPPCWHYPQEVCGVSEQDIAEVWRSIKKDENFWLELEPLPGAIEVIERLNQLRTDGHDIYFVTDRPGLAAKRQSEIWISQYGMPVPTVLMTGDKAGAVDLLDLDAYIDDRLENANLTMAEVRHQGLLTRVYLKHAGYNDRPVMEPDTMTKYSIDSSRIADVRDIGLIVVDSVKEMLETEVL